VKARKNNPNIAIKICDECIRQYLCQECDELAHRAHDARHHQRRTLVIGPGIRKRIIRRGDAASFPYSLDEVKVKLKSRVYHKGQIIHREPTSYAKFRVGLSGISVHVQILGGRNLLISDINNTSDPFVTAVYSGSKLGSTRVRPRDLNPQWDNETFVVPMDDNFPDPKGMQRSQRHLFKLEVYDYDWFSFNDFLGHVEIPRKKLYKMALASKEKPICLPLTTREFHGIVGVNLGFDNKELYVKVVRAESLDKVHPFGLDNPYAKVYFGDRLLGSTPVSWNTLDPEWIHSNVFRIKINDVLARERDILLYIKEKAASLMAEATPQQGENGIQYAGSSVYASSTSSSQHIPGVTSQSQGLSASAPSGSKSFDRSSQSDSHSRSATVDLHQDRQHPPLPAVKPKELQDMVSMNLLDDSQLLFRIELFDFNTYLSHSPLGTARIGVQFLRKLLPSFPKAPVVEKLGLVSQLTRRFGLESNRGASSRSMRGLKSIRDRSIRSAGNNSASMRSGDDSVSNREEVGDAQQAMSSKKTGFGLGLFSGRTTSLRGNSVELSSRVGYNSSRLTSQKLQSVDSPASLSIGTPALGPSAEGAAKQVDGDPASSARLSDERGKQKSARAIVGPDQSPNQPGILSRQISNAIFGRLMSNKHNSPDDGAEEDEFDHEELLEEVYGSQLEAEELEDDVLNNVGKRVVDAADLDIHQNYQPTERKRIGGKVLKVAAYQDLMAKKALRDKGRHVRSIHAPASPTPENRSGSVSGPHNSRDLQQGESAGQSARKDESVTAEGPLTERSRRISMSRSRAVTFEDSVEMSGSLKIGEIGFENEDSLNEGGALEGHSQDFYVMNEQQFQPSGHLTLDEHDGQGSIDADASLYQYDEQPPYGVHDANYNHFHESPGDATASLADSGDSLRLDYGQPGITDHEDEGNDGDEFQAGELNAHVQSPQSSIGSLRSHHTQGSHPSYQSNFSGSHGHHRKQSQSSYVPGQQDHPANSSQSTVENDIIMENYVDSGPEEATAHRHHFDDAHFGTAYAPEGLVPVGFEADLADVYEKDNADEADDRSSGSISADDLEREDSINTHRSGNILHVDHNAIYAEEEGDEFRPLLHIERASDGKLRPRNTIMNMLRRFSAPGTRPIEEVDLNNTDSEKKSSRQSNEGDFGYMKTLVSRSTRFVSTRMSMLVGRSTKDSALPGIDEEE
jgi:hypothetical protein